MDESARGGERRARPGQPIPTRVDVRIRLEQRSPPTGDAGISGQGPAQPFVGWLDLLRVLGDLFGDDVQPPRR